MSREAELKKRQAALTSPPRDWKENHNQPLSTIRNKEGKISRFVVFSNCHIRS